MNIVGVIPARYASSRYPGKPLVKLLGKPMIIWVAEAAIAALGDNVFVATEDERIADVVSDFGLKAVMTSDRPLTGTDRLWEFSLKVEADLYVNIQGDEPLIEPSDILKVLECKKQHPDETVCGMRKISSDEDPSNVNLPKVVVTKDMRMAYMSRLPVPGSKSADKVPDFWKQVCIYAFDKAQLAAFGEFGGKGYAEHFEDIEMLRFLELGIATRMVEVGGSSYAVDVPGDVEIVENALRKKYGL